MRGVLAYAKRDASAVTIDKGAKNKEESRRKVGSNSNTRKLRTLNARTNNYPVSPAWAPT